MVVKGYMFVDKQQKDMQLKRTDYRFTISTTFQNKDNSENATMCTKLAIKELYFLDACLMVLPQ